MDPKLDAPSAEAEELTSDGNRRFGPYILLHAVGAGGMGRVHIAVSGRPGMAKACVLKRMSSELGSPEQEARFRREASVALRLSHGAIAQTFAVDEIEGELCILQELIQGVSLGHLLRNFRSAAVTMPIETAIHIVRELARALAYAHRLEEGGVIHRDVTPDNVMLSYGGEVKLIDFGIAKGMGDPSLTQTGMIVGRWTHTAPEVLEGGPADARSDLYSLGVVLWQSLTGRVAPEESGGEWGSLGKRAAGVVVPLPPPSQVQPEVSAELDEIVKDLLSENPDDRFQTAEELQEALGSLLPVGFVGDREVARLLARTYDVDRERAVLAAEVARAEKLLGAPAPASSPEGRPAAKSGAPSAFLVAVAGEAAPGTRPRSVTQPWHGPGGAKARIEAARIANGHLEAEDTSAKALQRPPQTGSTERVRWRDGRWSVAVAGLAGAAVVAIVLALFHEGAPTSGPERAEPLAAAEAAAAGFSAGPPKPGPAATPSPVPAAGVAAAAGPDTGTPAGLPAATAGSVASAAPSSLPAVPAPEGAPGQAGGAETPPAAAPSAVAPPAQVAAAVEPSEAPAEASPEGEPSVSPPVAMGATSSRGKGRTPVPASASERRRLPLELDAASGPRSADSRGTDPKAAADLLARAERSFDVGDVSEALSLARAAVSVGGGQRAYMLAGKALLAEGKLAEAEGELVQAVRLAPGDAAASALLDRVRARRARHAGQ